MQQVLTGWLSTRLQREHLIVLWLNITSWQTSLFWIGSVSFSLWPALSMWQAGNIVFGINDQICHTPLHLINLQLFVAFCLSPSGTHQDREEAGGVGVIVSGNRSAGAGPGEESGVGVSVCLEKHIPHDRVSSSFSREFPSLVWAGENNTIQTGAPAKQLLRNARKCDSQSTSKRTTGWCVQNENDLQANYKEWPKKSEVLWV